MRAYDALARLAPAGLAGYRSGDLLARLVTDIDSLADRWLRVRLPFAAAALAGAGAVAVVGVLSPAAGLVLAATLVVSALAAPAVAIALSRREERDLVPLRGELAAATMELLDGAAELAAFGADGRALAAVQGKGARVGDATIRSGHARGAGAAVSALAAGAAVWGAVFFAVPAVRGGALAGRAARRRRAHPARGARGLRRARPGRAAGPPVARGAGAGRGGDEPARPGGRAARPGAHCPDRPTTWRSAA